jgi:hypothetical protein
LTGGDADHVGFDCGHAGDYCPYASGEQFDWVYRDMEYVKAECEKLASYLVEWRKNAR